MKRLAWYLVGFSVGLIFLVFIVNKKSGENGIEICYFPNCRVLKDIRSKPLITEENDTLTFDELNPKLKAILLEGSIDFGKSDTSSDPCKVYVIEHGEESGGRTEMTVKNCPEKATITEITKGER